MEIKYRKNSMNKIILKLFTKEYQIKLINYLMIDSNNNCYNIKKYIQQ